VETFLIGCALLGAIFLVVCALLGAIFLVVGLLTTVGDFLNRKGILDTLLSNIFAIIFFILLTNMLGSVFKNYWGNL
jgi:hypothetical protein